MALATNYLEQNDYTPLKYSPYKLNVNDIARTLAVKRAYWEQGAQRVKARYQDALGLNVTNKENQNIVKDYLNQSVDSIKKLSSEDLSNPDIQEQGISIFKPLFEDRGVMFDDQYTKHLQKVRSDYYTQLKKDPSKASTTNLAYALEDEQNFKNDPDRNSAETYYGKRKDFIPYYDPTSEISGIMKQCKASTSNSLDPNYTSKNGMTGYSTEIDHKFLSEQKVKSCFDAGLSQQARQQINITGYMAFKNNKEALADAYSSNNYTSIKRLNLEMDQMALREAELLNKQKAGALSTQEKDVLKAIQTQKIDYGSQIDNYNQINGRLAKKDFTDLDKDFEGIAGSIFTDMKLSKFGSAFSYDEYSRKFISDPTQMLHIKQTFEAKQQYNQQQFELEKQRRDINADMALENLKAAHTSSASSKKNSDGSNKFVGLNGDEQAGFGVDDDKLPLNIGTDVGDGESYSDFEKEVTENKTQLTEQNKYLATQLLNYDDTFKTSIGESYLTMANGDGTFSKLKYNDLLKKIVAGENYNLEELPTIVKYVTTQSKDRPDYNNWLGVTNALATNKMFLDEKSKTLENQIPQELKTSSKNIDNVGSTKIDFNGKEITISAKDMLDAMEGKTTTNGFSIIKNSKELSKWDNTPTYAINGQTLPGGMFSPSDYLGPLYNRVKNVDETRVEQLNETRRKLYGNQSWQDHSYYRINSDDKASNVATLRTALEGVIADNDSKQKINIIGTDYQGGVKVYIPNATQTSADDIQTKVGGLEKTSSGRAPGVKDIGDGNFLIQGLSNFDYSKQLGLNPASFKQAMTLKAISENLQPGQSKETSFFANAEGVRMKYGLEVINTPAGTMYLVKDPKGVVRLTSYDAFELVHQIQYQQNTVK